MYWTPSTARARAGDRGRGGALVLEVLSIAFGAPGFFLHWQLPRGDSRGWQIKTPGYQRDPQNKL